MISKVQRSVSQKSYPENYFSLATTVLSILGMYPISSNHRCVIRVLYSFYFWWLCIFIVILNPISKAIALYYNTKLDDLTDNISYLINHMMCCFKMALFMYKRNDLIKLIETIEGEEFRHQDCEKFSANNLIRKAIRMTKTMYFIYSTFVIGLLVNSCLSATLERSEDILDSNGTESVVLTQRHRALPFHAWYPFSTQISPNYEIAFIYQMVAVCVAAQMAMALDTLTVSFMIHTKVQFEILSHNLRYIVDHAKKTQKNLSVSGVNFQIVDRDGSNADFFMEQAVELNLAKYIAHHKAILRLSEGLAGVFSNQLLLQFVCSLLSTCMLLWQVSSTPVLSARFASMLSCLGACGFQLLIYCWFGNELMLESLSVAKATWDNEWYKLVSKQYRHGILMMMHRSQKVVMMTAGGFFDLTLDTFMTILQTAYSCFAVLKKMDN